MPDSETPPIETTAVVVGKQPYRYPSITPQLADEALLEFNGDRKLAAEFLRIAPSKLTEIINRSAVMRERWGKPKTVSAEPPTAVTRSPQEVVQAMNAENEQMTNRGLRSMGATDKDVETVRILRKFVGQSVDSLLGIYRAGAILSSVKLQGLMREDEERFSKMLKDGFPLDEDGKPSQELCIREGMAANHKAFIDYGLMISKMSLDAAKIESLKQAGKNGGRKMGSPGFQPKGDTKIVTNSVTINK